MFQRVTGRRPLLFIPVLLSVLVAAPGYARRTASGRIELRVWNTAQVDGGRAGRRPGPNPTRIFQERNPDIEIVPVSQLRIEVGESRELLAIAGGTAPDVLDEFGRVLQTYAAKDLLRPLDPYLADHEKRTGEGYEGIWAPGPIWESARYEGKYYGVPRAYYTMQLYWRKDLFRKAGVDPNQAPKSWDDLFRIGMALSSRSNDMEVIGGKEVRSDRFGIILFGGSWTFQNFFWAAGGEVVRQYVRCPKCGTLAPVPHNRVDFRKDHISIMEEDYYYSLGMSQRTVCPKCGEVVVEDRLEDALAKNPNLDVEWRLVVNEQPGVEALKFYRKLLHQPWTRCPEHDEDDEFELTDEMFETGTAVCPVCKTEYRIDDLRDQGRIYRGVATQADEGDPDFMQQFTRGRAAMVICWNGAALTMVNLGLSNGLIGQGPLPPGPGGEKANFIAGGYYAINAASDDESAEAAWRYIEFVTSPEWQKIYLTNIVQEGNAIYQWPSVLLRYGFTDIFREIPPDWVNAEKEILRHAHVEPYCPGYKDVPGRIEEPLTRIKNEDPEKPVDVQAALDKICGDVNTRFLGTPPPEEMARKRLLTWLLLSVLATFFLVMSGIYIRGLMQQQHMKHDGGRDAIVSGASRRRQRVYAGLFLSIALISVALWAYVPLIQGSIMAFYDWRIIGESKWVGIENFARILWDKEFYMIMWRTFQYVGISLLIGFPIPIVLALLLHEIPRGKILYRTLYYLPAVTSALVTLFLWKKLFYGPTSEGLLNQMIAGVLNPVIGWINTLFNAHMAPFQPIDWLQNQKTALLAIIIPGIWAGAGPGCLIYLAALKSVPDEEYEAAEIDGAGMFQKIRHITIPNLSALILINFVGAFIGSFHAMQNIFVMAPGNPATRVIGIEIWMNAFLHLELGYATAMAWILGSLLIGFTVYQLNILRRVEFRAAGTGAG